MPDQSTSAVPPPTSEITVRTLASDLASVASTGGSGGLAPQGVTVVQPHVIHAGTASHLISSILGWLAVFIALLALGAGGWLGYRYVSERIDTAPPATTSTTPTAAVPGRTGPLASLPATVPAHKSLLAKSPISVSFPLVPPAGSLQTRFQLLRDGLAKIPATSRVAEIVPTDASGAALSFPGYATVIGAPDLMAADAFKNYFQDDFTILAIRSQGGFGAAYLLSLKPNTAWLYVQPSIRAMEQVLTLPNLFLQVPGSRSSDFADGGVQDTPVRTATFENPAGTLVYGYFRDRLIIATSQQALDEALLRICFAPGSC